MTFLRMVFFSYYPLGKQTPSPRHDAAGQQQGRRQEQPQRLQQILPTRSTPKRAGFNSYADDGAADAEVGVRVISCHFWWIGLHQLCSIGVKRGEGQHGNPCSVSTFCLLVFLCSFSCTFVARRGTTSPFPRQGRVRRWCTHDTVVIRCKVEKLWRRTQGVIFRWCSNELPRS